MQSRATISLTREERKIDDVQEVPNITTLEKQVESCMVGWKPTWNEKHSESWNLIFHQIITKCDIRGHYLDSNLPKCYKLGNTCGHLLHVELEDSASNTLQLTMLESVGDKSSPFSFQVASAYHVGKAIISGWGIGDGNW